MPFGITLTIDLRDRYDAVVLADPPVIPSKPDPDTMSGKGGVLETPESLLGLGFTNGGSEVCYLIVVHRNHLPFRSLNFGATAFTHCYMFPHPTGLNIQHETVRERQENARERHVHERYKSLANTRNRSRARKPRLLGDMTQEILCALRLPDGQRPLRACPAPRSRRHP